jgi:hypothetical protein
MALLELRSQPLQGENDEVILARNPYDSDRSSDRTLRSEE